MPTRHGPGVKSSDFPLLIALQKRLSTRAVSLGGGALGKALRAWPAFFFC